MINATHSKNFYKVLRLSAIVTALIFNSGCYHSRILTSHNDPSTNYTKKTVNSFFWGLVQHDVIATDCDAMKLKSIDEVRVSTNLGYALITVFTLGIWCPMQIEWKCPKPCPREGGM